MVDAIGIVSPAIGLSDPKMTGELSSGRVTNDIMIAKLEERTPAIETAVNKNTHSIFRVRTICKPILENHEIITVSTYQT